MHPEERRIAGLLRELIAETGASLHSVEDRLQWEPGRLISVLDGGERLALDDLYDLLPELGATPAEFFAWLYGFEPGDTHASLGSRGSGQDDSNLPASARSLDQRFEKSLRVVRSAMERRRVWKMERGEV
jgi:hypothetical protein